MALQYPFQAVLEALIKARQAPPPSAYAANAVSTGLGAYNTANEQRMKNEQLNRANLVDLNKAYLAQKYTPTVPTNGSIDMQGLGGVGGQFGILGAPSGLPTATSTPAIAQPEQLMGGSNVTWNKPQSAAEDKLKQGWYLDKIKNKAVGIDGKELPIGTDFSKMEKLGEIGVNTRQDADERQQERLAKDYRNDLQKSFMGVRNPIAIEESKINQAIHLQTILNENRDKVTGEYKIPPSMHTELAMGMARLINPAGVAQENVIKKLEQVTARQGLAGALIFLGANPTEVGGTTQSVAQFFANQVKRQGLTSEKLKNDYIERQKARAPRGLDKEYVDYINRSEFGSRYSDFLPGGQGYESVQGQSTTDTNAPTHILQVNDITGERRASNDGGKTWKMLPAIK